VRDGLLAHPSAASSICVLYLQHERTYCITALQFLVQSLTAWSLRPTPADCCCAVSHIAWPPRFPRHAAIRTEG
jgi:hypothetical protein